MGINIGLYKLEYQENEFETFKMKSVKDWDRVRQGCDVFVDSSNVAKIYLSGCLEDESYWRPMDIKSLIEHIEQKEEIGSMRRWVPILKKIKTDGSYWFQTSR